MKTKWMFWEMYIWLTTLLPLKSSNSWFCELLYGTFWDSLPCRKWDVTQWGYWTHLFIWANELSYWRKKHSTMGFKGSLASNEITQRIYMLQRFNSEKLYLYSRGGIFFGPASDTSYSLRIECSYCYYFSLHNSIFITTLCLCTIWEII